MARTKYLAIAGTQILYGETALLATTQLGPVRAWRALTLLFRLWGDNSTSVQERLLSRP